MIMTYTLDFRWILDGDVSLIHVYNLDVSFLSDLFGPKQRTICDTLKVKYLHNDSSNQKTSNVSDKIFYWTKKFEIHMSCLAWDRVDCLLFASFDVKKMAIGHIFLTSRLNLKRPIENNIYFILAISVAHQIGCCWLLCVLNWCRFPLRQFAHFCLLLIIFFQNQDIKTTIHSIIVHNKRFRMVPLDLRTVGWLLRKGRSRCWWRICPFLLLVDYLLSE